MPPVHQISSEVLDKQDQTVMMWPSLPTASEMTSVSTVVLNLEVRESLHRSGFIDEDLMHVSVIYCANLIFFVEHAPRNGQGSRIRRGTIIEVPWASCRLHTVPYHSADRVSEAASHSPASQHRFLLWIDHNTEAANGHPSNQKP